MLRFCATTQVASQSKRRRLVLAQAVLILASYPAQAIVFQDATAQSAGLGAGQSFLDGEAALTISMSDNTTGGCTGSLLAGGLYVLTAAHCVTGGSNNLLASFISLSFANVGLSLTATQYVVDPTWTGNLLDGGDLALIKLSAPVTTITGYTLDTAGSLVGAAVVMAGYGNTGVGATGYVGGSFGVLRYGRNVYDGTYSDVPLVYASDFDKVGTSAYNAFGPGAVGSDEALIAPGDSGGGSLVQIGNTWELVGVHDFIGCVTTNCTPNSSFGQIAGDSSVYANQAWLASVLNVPEPGTATLAVVALAGLAVAVRRRRIR